MISGLIKMVKKAQPNEAIKVEKLPSSFEEGVAELTQLIANMENGNLPLEYALQAYARGSQLVQYCAAQLEKAEQQIKIVENGLLTPFNPEQQLADLD